MTQHTCSDNLDDLAAQYLTPLVVQNIFTPPTGFMAEVHEHLDSLPKVPPVEYPPEPSFDEEMATVMAMLNPEQRKAVDHLLDRVEEHLREQDYWDS